MIVRDHHDRYLGIRCDECDTDAPDTKTILAGHGLTNLGWYCRGGTHICPAHPHPRDPEQIEADREANGGAALRNEGSVR